MTQALIKIHNIDHLLYESFEKMQQLIRDDFHSYSIKCEIHRVVILENQNMTLCSLLYENSYYEYSEKDKLFSVYLNNNKERKEDKVLIMEMKIQQEQNVNKIKESYYQKQISSKFKGPLSYEPLILQRTSLLSSESPEQNYRGLINLAVLILLINHLRLIIENFIKYGFLLKNVDLIGALRNYDEQPLIFCILHLLANLGIAMGIQYLSFIKKFNSKLTLYSNIINITSLFVQPVIWIQESHPIVNIFFLLMNTVIMMKLVSYAHVMRNMRHFLERAQQVEDKKNRAPLKEFFSSHELNPSYQNLEILRKAIKKPLCLLNINHFIYFMVAPTMCFQFAYPRSPSIRWIWLFKRIVELLAVNTFQIILWFQYVEPLLYGTYKQYALDGYQFDFLKSSERILKLAIPNTYMWIAFFFATFQCLFNIIAELLRFGDRQFYLDWWNCRNLEEYWKLWNLPVHQWLTRHLYFPILKRGYSKAVGSLVVFLVSALGHEIVMSASIGQVEYWAFIGMLSQAPVIMVQKKIEKLFKLQNSQLGNVMFWVSFCFLGQPLMLFVYYYAFQQKHSIGQLSNNRM